MRSGDFTARYESWNAAPDNVHLTLLLYNWGMFSIAASEARNGFAAVIAQAQHEAVFIERRGETQAVVISTREYDRLLEASDEVEDVAAFDAALAEEGPNIPWDQVKADLGW